MYNRTFTPLKQLFLVVAFIAAANTMQGQCVATGSTLNSVICGGDTFYVGPNAHTQAGAYSDTLTNANGCDSVVTLTLIVNHRYNDTLVQNICTGDSFSFAGIWHRTAGYYYDSLVTVNGCDSIIALNLIVNPPVTQTIHDTICTGDTVNFNGHAYTTTGIRRDTLTTVNGCDSIVVLNLIVRPILTSSISRSICRGGNFDFNGRNITVAGTYKDTLTTSLGCDSVVTLTLSYTADVPHYINVAICHGENYVFHGNTLTYSGVYSDTLVSSGGCDSLVILNLEILPDPIQPYIVASGNTLTSSAASAYQWFLNGSLLAGDTSRSIAATQNGNYQVQITGPNGCRSLSQGYNENALGISGVVAEWDVKLYPNPNKGSFVIAFSDNVIRTLQITDALGRVIMADENVSGTKEFNLTSLAGGVYFTRIKQQEVIKTIRFVVVR